MPMPTHEQRAFPRWETFYQEEQNESMPWFTPALDDDPARALDAGHAPRPDGLPRGGH